MDAIEIIEREAEEFDEEAVKSTWRKKTGKIKVKHGKAAAARAAGLCP